MVVLMGLSDPNTYNLNTYILDMNQWKWVNSLSNTTTSLSASTCQFTLPSVSSADYVEFNYDYSVLNNPNTPPSSGNDKKKEGFGIGFGLFVIALIGLGVWFYLRRKRRNNARKLNPRWMRNVTTPNASNDRDYPLFVYNKELDKGNTNNPNRPAQYNSQVRTYTASDHEELEQRVSSTDDIPTSDIWKRMRQINNNEAPSQNDAKLLDV